MAYYLFNSDRNFNDDIDDQSYYYVVTHNDLITRASHDLTARELKIMDFVISKIKPGDRNFNVIETSMYEMGQLFGYSRSGKNYSDLAKAIGTLRKKEVLILDEQNRTITQTGWVQSAKYHESGQVQIELSPDLAPYLLQLKSDYTQYRLFDTVQLDSKYSIRLYKLMRESNKDKGKTRPTLQATPEELARMMGSPKSYSFGDFNRNVLQPAMDEINLKIDDMDLEMHKGTRGRKVVHVEIYNRFYPQNPKPEDKNSETVPMFNWLNESTK